MAAPIKSAFEQTGNFKPLAVFLAAASVLAGSLLYAMTLPSAVVKPPNPESQVAGLTTQDEYVPPEDTAPAEAMVSDTKSNSYLVKAVSDGDTIKVSIDGKIETIRLIGVDTPETRDPRKSVQCYGRQASDFTKTSLLGKNVRLVPDDSQQNRDKYGRLLRYVYLQDGTLFNQLLIESGYAYEYTYKVPYEFSATFKAAQIDATNNKIGLWNETTCSGNR